MKHLLPLVLLSACSTELAFQTPQSWDAYAEFASEHALPSTFPDPGQRPAEFSCAVMSPAGCLLVESDDPAWTTFYLLGLDGDWTGPVTLPTEAHEFVSIDLYDGTDVFVVGNLLIFDGAFTELDSCDAHNVVPSKTATCVAD